MEGVYKFEKLRGRENYDTWKQAAESYLTIRKHWSIIEKEVTIDTSNKADDTIAKAELNMPVETINYPYIRQAKTAHEAWKNLESAFEDSGITRKVAVLQALVSMKLDNCESMEDYVNRLTVLWAKVTKVGFKIDDEIVGALMLGGLPDQYKPLVMTLENSDKKLTMDKVKTILLQDASFENSSGDQSVMYSKKKWKQKKSKTTAKCWKCDEPGHIAVNCKRSTTKEEEKNKSCVLYSALVAKNDNDDWFIDSGASAHMTMKRNILEGVKPVGGGNVIVANNAKMAIECSGDVPIVNDSGQHIMMRNVLYVPDLCTNLVSVSQMIKNGNKVVFGANKCVIWDKYGDVLATATLVDDMFKLNCKLAATDRTEKATIVKEERATVAKLHPDIWHRRLGHAGIEKLKNLPSVAEGIEAAF